MDRLMANSLPLMSAAVISLLGNSNDILLFLVLSMSRNWDTTQHLLPSIKVVIDFAKVPTVLFICLQIYRYIRGLQQTNPNIDGLFAKPMLFPCRTSHTRLFPKKHSFSYSYFVVGIPIGWSGTIGGMISADIAKEDKMWYQKWFTLKRFGSWFTVNGDDYLARGHVAGGLKEKLHDYLKSQGEDSKEYPYAYLLTAPRFLNYSSNPVSIWHLYSAPNILSAMILEVNNTFDERHSYFLKAEPAPADPPTIPILETPISSSRFTQSWPKDFYVSVFNSRTGHYSLSTSTPVTLHQPMTSSTETPHKHPGINTTITLSSSKSHPKLTARLFSTSPPVVPSNMTALQKTWFLLTHSYIGLLTFPRTVVQALTILLKKKIGLSWVFRPEPRRDTIPRKADELETLIEGFLRTYLRTIVERSDTPVKLRYTPAGLIDTMEEIMLSPSAQLLNDEAEEIELRILTPIFYSRFIRYTDFLDGVFSESKESFTIEMKNKSALAELDFEVQEHQKKKEVGFLMRTRLYLLAYLRSRPSPIENTESLKAKAKAKAKLNSEATLTPASSDLTNKLSQFENYILSLPNTHRERAGLYLSQATRLFLADRIAFGWMEILDLQVFMVKFTVLWILAGSLVWS